MNKAFFPLARLSLASALASLAFLLPSAPAGAAQYEMHLYRDAPNLYRDLVSKVRIRTSNCLEPADGADAVLDSARGEVTFTGSRKKCGVEVTYDPARIRPGQYRVRVSRKDEGLYEEAATGYLITTSRCRNLSPSDEAELRMRTPLIGEILFGNGGSCDVEGILKKSPLP